MGILEDILKGIEAGRKQFEHIMRSDNGDASPFEYVEKHIYNDNIGSERSFASELALGDNLRYMRWLIAQGYGGRFRLLYLDPPFFTKAKYNATVSVHGEDGKKHRLRHLAYDDTFERNLEYYVENMTARLLMMRELLAEDGTMWIHLDWHSSHYIKIIMDELMGEKNFVNEIIWSYKSCGSGKRHFARKHDSILVYSKTKNYYLNVPTEKSYNRGFKPYHFKGVEEFQDDQGWYTLVNMKDVWTIDMVGRTSSERTGYATQKPLELMRRIIEASSENGDLVGDFFSGSGSFLEEAERLGRRWIGCDNEELATAMAKKRLDLIEADYIYRTENGMTLRLGRLDLELKQKEELENGKCLFNYSVKRFDPEIEIGYIQMNDRRYVEEALTNDTIQFIDYVMIDPDYSGTFSCEIVSEDFENIRFLSRGNAAVIAVDVFGREYFIRTDNE